LAKERQPKAFLACYLVIVRGGKILLSLRRNTGYRDGMYTMVAGHLEENESVFQALAREAKEEAGLDLDQEKMRVIHVMHRLDADREYVDFFVSAIFEEEPRNMEPEKCEGLHWFDLERIPGNTIPYVRQAIDNIRVAEPFSEYSVR
jgi:8-oxo-dGTP pyrophosphatase MutT (NUDIX family)